MPEINLEWYRSFYWCAKTGSLSRAAEKLHITQPAVSHTLKQLEEMLGGALFIRGARGVQLTAEGELLFRYVEQAFNFVEAGEKKILEMHQLAFGEIRIGAGDSLCKHFLLPYLAQYHRLYPQIRIRVTNRTTPETLALLKEGAIDLGIVNLPAADGKADITASSPQQDCLVGGRHYAHLAGEPLRLQALERYPLLMLEEGTSTRRHLDKHAEAFGVKLQPELELGSMDLLADFAKNGLGLAFVVRDNYRAELHAGELVEIPLVEPVPPRGIGIATLHGVPRSEAAKRFLELLPAADEKKAE
ncbi:LysR family transcriptional regulator [Paenibacillus rhizovicinus]|uniref:LysR family transcriptional regulator n=1 Tax=Paenibacillus rhizovicinus TaxID=2704463 RepID=A0A6C0PC49_9BACL|nr:LysR family transcriptional regulator [Paenibacillus rhizovicinus]QHW34292.1 LysR family transcriptional regulator [Paenibacillus rhizovicinus]